MAKSRKNGKEATPRLTLKRWGVANWMNFKEVAFDLGDRLFIVGPNASGKSNLQDSLRFLRDIVSVGGGLQGAVARRGGLKAIRCLAARAQSTVQLSISVQAPEGEGPLWVYDLAIKQDSQRVPLIESEKVVCDGTVILNRPDAEDVADPERLRQTAIEQVTANREFRVVADFLSSIEYLHLVPQIVRDPDRLTGRRDDPFGGGLLERIAGTTERTRKAWLGRILEALKIAVPQINELILERDDRGVPHLRGNYSHWRPQGAWQDESQFSDGTLRLIGLLWSVLDGHGPLLLEEPELSLHSEIVRHLPRLLFKAQSRTQRQTIISTHSSDLLTDSGIGLDEVLILLPVGSEGTRARLAADDDEARRLLEGGLSMAEAVLPRTAPGNSSQLHLFEL